MKAMSVLLATGLVLAASPAAASPEMTFFVRTNPLAVAANGRTTIPEPGGGQMGLFPDLVGAGFTMKALEFSVHLTQQNVLPDENEFSLLMARASAAWRPLGTAGRSIFDPYLFAGLGFGGAGRYVRTSATCTGDDCGMSRDGFGGGLHAGAGLDFNFGIFDIGQTTEVGVSVGFEVREEIFVGSRFGYFTVWSLPISLRLR